MKTTKIAYMGVLLALVTVLSYVEQSLPPIPLLPPGVKPGLSNVITMYCVFFFGPREGFGLAAAKSGFVALLRGPIAGLLSLAGGMLSVLTLCILNAVFKARASYTANSICAATAHNLGQTFAVSLILGSGLAMFYFPALIVSGVIFGMVTGVTLNVLLPVFHRFFKGDK